MRIKIHLLLAISLCSYFHYTVAQQTGKWGDQGDGTFRNPIISADYSDPDPIRVGEDYYMVASTFESSPGVTILHSKDLVNWQYSGSVFTDLTKVHPDFSWETMERYGEGVFAPSLRYHDGKFWVFVNFYTDGFFMATANHPSEEWDVHAIKDKNGNELRTRGWTDPCPFWDDDGKAYLASSKVSDYWFGYLFEMTPDGKQLLDADFAHMSEEERQYEYPNGGTLFSPFQSNEGNKIYKRNGYYYLIHIEFLPDGQGCGTYVMRSKNIYGTKDDGTPGKPGDPGKYEIYKIGEDGCEGINQEFPGQGGLVNTPDDRWFWIGQFNRLNQDGYRCPHLVPVTWIDDWPVFGADVEKNKGYFKWQMEKPIEGHDAVFPFISDEFDSKELNKVWQWNHQPNNDKWSLTEAPGFLRLKALKTDKKEAFYKAGNTINQRHFKSDTATVTIKININGMVNGQFAGLAHFTGGEDYGATGVLMKGNKKTLYFDLNGKIKKLDQLGNDQEVLVLQTTTGFDGIARWRYSFDGKRFQTIEGEYRLSANNFRGDMVGVYNYNTESESGFVDIDWFRYRVVNK